MPLKNMSKDVPDNNLDTHPADEAAQRNAEFMADWYQSIVAAKAYGEQNESGKPDELSKYVIPKPGMEILFDMKEDPWKITGCDENGKLVIESSRDKKIKQTIQLTNAFEEPVSSFAQAENAIPFHYFKISSFARIFGGMRTLDQAVAEIDASLAQGCPITKRPESLAAELFPNIRTMRASERSKNEDNIMSQYKEMAAKLTDYEDILFHKITRGHLLEARMLYLQKSQSID